jgi:hypothetical protein
VSFTYSAAWTGSRDYVRFLVGDTVAPGEFQDEELDAMLVQWSGDARMAAADVLDVIVIKMSRNAIKYWFTGFGLDRTETVDGLKAAAKSLREQAMSVPFEFESVVDHYVTAYGEDWSSYMDTHPEGTGRFF